MRMGRAGGNFRCQEFHFLGVHFNASFGMHYDPLVAGN